MLWRVLYVMQCAETEGLETLSTASDTHFCIQALRGTSRHALPTQNIIFQTLTQKSKNFLKLHMTISSTDPEHQKRFEQWLCEVNSSDGISLLTALAHMATPTQQSDPTFITTITLLIYQV